MATAPRPGARREAEAAQQWFRITVGDETLEMPAALSKADRLAVRRHTKLPVEVWFSEDSFGLDSLMVMWWLARRANGEPSLQWPQAVHDFPDNLAEDDVEFEVIDSDDPAVADRPEA